MRRSLLFASAILTTHAFAALHLIQPRVVQPFDSDWRFTQSDPAHAKSPSFDDTQWQSVALPHDNDPVANQGQDCTKQKTEGKGYCRRVLHWCCTADEKRRQLALNWGAIQQHGCA